MDLESLEPVQNLSSMAPPDLFPQASPPIQNLEVKSTHGIEAIPDIKTSFDDTEASPSNDLGSETADVADIHSNGISLSSATSLDLAEKINGYRLIELISEQSSNGLVGKTVISQEHLGRFINHISPGAYASVTQVDFASLDQYLIKPIGVYGSRSQIVELLLEIKAVDQETASLLNATDAHMSAHTRPNLTSGLYIFEAPSDLGTSKQFYVVYWPEETTWNDNAAPTVVKNRITFMRYLTKITDQVLCLISPEHAQTLVFRADTTEDPDWDEEDEDSEDRMFSFKVAKTNEKEEGVTMHPGFELFHRDIKASEPPQHVSLDERILQPVIVQSETQQAFMTVSYKHEEATSRQYQEVKYEAALRSLVKSRGNLVLSDQLSDEALNILTRFGLQERFPEAVDGWKKRNSMSATQVDHDKAEPDAISFKIRSDHNHLEAALESVALQKILSLYSPFFSDIDLSGEAMRKLNKEEIYQYLEHLRSLYPDIQKVEEHELNKIRFHDLSTNRPYAQLKYRYLIVRHLLNEFHGLDHEEKQDLAGAITGDDPLENLLPASILEGKHDDYSFQIVGNRFVQAFQTVSSLWNTGKDRPSEIIRHAQKAASVDDKSDLVFLQGLMQPSESEPLMLESIVKMGIAVRDELKDRVSRFVRAAVTRIEEIQINHLEAEVRRMAKDQMNKSRLLLIDEINKKHDPILNLGVTLEQITEKRGSPRGSNKQYEVSYKMEHMKSACLVYSTHVLAHTTDDKQKLKLIEQGSTFIPRPSVAAHVPTFNIPIGERIRHIQIFENNRCLLILENSSGDIRVFLEVLHSLAYAVDSGMAKAAFSHTKLAPDVVFAVDETCGLLAIVTSGGDNACRLHIYRIMIMEQSSPITGRGTPITLHSWHTNALHVTKACFVAGVEEILLVDGLTARIYSLVTQQYRPASLQFVTEPSAVFSSPEGACLLAIEQESRWFGVRSYHWDSFGSRDGVFFKLPVEATSLGMTSLVQRNIVHILTLSAQDHACRSVSLRITRQSSEFQFRAQDAMYKTSSESPQKTQHNCLLDCYPAVWTRFPVVPAIKRSTIRPEGREPGWIQFITAHGTDHDAFAKYFHDTIASFEKTTRKPFDEDLRHRHVTGTDTIDRSRTSSRFCTGEWLVELLCLIPIQISVVRDNRFIPLRDGVFSPDLERSLLGADLPQVVDNLTFGWYESLLGSYYIGKPVKVVSSMGQQSVGKSYMINHFTDSSFQGSAMRTTEGCWMSLTPTEDHLIVSLDFEGLDSIERSAQEDTLLVLFNAAISNLVLFRNNFALSRDLAGSFQSFQSSSLVLDPAANPTLFQGKLVIIVKDVTDVDSTEIVKEFSQKLHKIVTQEQDSNFITRLHKGSLDIIPWPVIESKKFYTMFGKLRKVFNEQPVTHPTAGRFISTLKTLMAKLKINDWGALDQNLATLRAQMLESILPIAFGYGLADLETESPLKDIDNDIVMPCGNDSSFIFHIPQPEVDDSNKAPQRFSILRDTFIGNCHRQEEQWTSDLSAYLNNLGDSRVQHVREWLNANTARFASHADIMQLQRRFQELAVALKAGLRLCCMGCHQCRLLCIEPRYHEGGHDCHTDHVCAFTCQYCDVQCRLAAGHDSHHLCDASAHLCGKNCDLSDKRGCLGGCTKTVNHKGEVHLCSTRNHQCGQACALGGVQLPNGSFYTCLGRCIISCDEDHENHVCEDRSCPITCQLCKRLCFQEHLHGLNDRTHLCGEEHPCRALCGQDGVCEVATRPHSVETTFQGTIDTFQYTKYSQVVKKLQCARMIPQGALSHDGDHHCHSGAQEIFHFCKERCYNCDYICTLPSGHIQKEHETSHGSCSKTQWAIEGPPGSVVELDGHKYAANDSGAPMLCNMICASIGRHVHIEYCRTRGTRCEGSQVQHIDVEMLPEVNEPKDYITHELYWGRTGFKDPYTREDQANFSKCDFMCKDPEHEATRTRLAQPSFCILPMFHAPPDSLAVGRSSVTQGYVSADGHEFSCRNPSIGHEAFHVIFLIDRSWSMSSRDRQPQLGSAATDRIIQRQHNNRLGAVYSALYGFWTARDAGVASLARQGGTRLRRDSYSVVMFDRRADIVPLENDLTNSPDQLLDKLILYETGWGTNFDRALERAQLILEQNWSTERSPVIIFLSDGEGSVKDNTVYDLAQKSQALGMSLRFHSVSFGRETKSQGLRRMKDIAAEVHARDARGVLAVPGVEFCSYTQAIDTIRLAETFLGFAESLQKPRASLLRGRDGTRLNRALEHKRPIPALLY